MRPSPINTALVLDRSPIMFLTGKGSLRTNVGMARICSSRAIRGYFKRSITFIWYLPFNFSSQMKLRLLKAVPVLGDSPATYRCKSHCSFCRLARRLFRMSAFDFSFLIFTLSSFSLSFCCSLCRLALCERRLFGSLPFLFCPE